MRRIVLILAVLALLTGCQKERYLEPDPVWRPMRGGASASVVVEEFADFQCPACVLAAAKTNELFVKFGDRVLWKYYHFPLTSIHPYAYNAALAAECTNDDGKFWEYADLLYRNQERLAYRDLLQYARGLDLNFERFKDCLDQKVKSYAIRMDTKLAKERGVLGTPTFYVNGAKLEQWSDLESVINALLAPAVPTAGSAEL